MNGADGLKTVGLTGIPLLVAFVFVAACIKWDSPLMQYFPVVIAFAQKYQKDAGIGTITAMMVPYSVALLVVWVLFFALWLLAGIPLGPGTPLYYSAPCSLPKAL